jgi:hypothetical protein
MNLQERKKRVIARGEHSNHAHVLTGDITFNSNGTFTVNNDGKIRHILETNWLDGQEVWTEEHKDIDLEKGTYKYVQQVEYDPYQDIIREVID